MAEREGKSEERHHVRIHIDQKPYESPNPTTGGALYKLGHVQPGYGLFREVRGDQEDAVVPDEPEPIHLREDEHFHSGAARPRKFTIVVNGRKKEVFTKTLSFDQVVALAFNPVPVGPNVQFSVTYRKGPEKNREGTLTEGESVQVKDEMIFDVSETNKS
ncbi:MAG TPA: multiubiquitin domain-containing protein [Terriglobales bacterium]|nr:multiubiquitin domain-containing protein [Terriglobales bacterium]